MPFIKTKYKKYISFGEKWFIATQFQKLYSKKISNESIF